MSSYHESGSGSVTANRLKDQLVRSLSIHYPAMLRGALGGSLVGLAVPTLENLFLAAWRLLKSSVGGTVAWPSRAWLFWVVIVTLGVSLCWQPALRYCHRLLASWKVDPSNGLFLIWLVFSPLELWSVAERWYGSSVLVLVVSIMLSATVLLRTEERRVPTGPNDIDSDIPIETSKRDILGRQSLVSKLTEELSDGAASVIALVGAYGDGKTSALNLLRESLRQKCPDMVVVPFVSSLATSEDVLVGTLFNSIAKELQKRFVYGRLGDALKRYASSLVGFVPKFGDALKELFRVPSQEDQIRQLKESLENLGVRVVVVVDDMDRMQVRELDVLLKLMRAPEFSNVTYLCAFDKEGLARVLAANRMSTEDARRYLEKFFPLQTPLPRIDSNTLAREFDRRFETLCKAHGLLGTENEQTKFKEHFSPLWQVHLSHYFSNLRRIKLFLNRIATAIVPIAKEICLADFILLEIIRDVAPDIYEGIYVHRRYFFYGEWMIETWPERLHPDDAKETELRKQFLDGLLHPLDSAKRTLVTELLCELFPAVREYRGDALARGGSSLEAKKGRRIFHPAFFPRYFIFGVQSDAFGEAEFDDLESDLKKCKGIESCKQHFKGVFETLPEESRRRWDLLDQLAIKIDRFGLLQAESVGVALAELSDRIQPPLLSLGEAEAARRIIFVVANLLASSSKVQQFLEQTIRASAADYFALLIIAACKDPSKNEILTQWEHVNVDRLHQSFRERMRDKYFKGGAASIFDVQNQKGAIRSLKAWLTAGGSEEIGSYLTDEFRRRPRSLGTLLLLMFPTEESSTQLHLRALSELYPLAQIENWLNEHGSKTYGTEEEPAVERFRGLLGSARMASLKFRMAEGSAWNATDEDGSILNIVNGQVLSDVSLAEDGLPVKRIFREAVSAGVAEIEFPASWVGDSATPPASA